MEVRSWKDR